MTPDPANPAAGDGAAPGSFGSAPGSYEHLALTAAGVGTWLWHISGGELVWGELTYRLFGVEPGGFQPSPRTVRELIHPEDRGRLDQQVAKCLASAPDFNVEYRVTWPSDGSVHHLRTRGKIYRSEDGRDVRMTGACWDITERKSLEEALAHERFLLRTLMEHLPDMIYFKDTQSRFILVSDGTMRWLGGKTLADIVGKTDFDFFTEEHARQAFADEQRILRTGEALRGYEEKETWPDGRETWASTTKLPLRDAAGKIIGTFGLSRDITDHRRAEEQLARYAEELRHRNRDLEDDLEMARELQGALMPRHYPTFEAADSRGSALRFSHVFNPSAVVSGDFFDIIKLSDTAAGIFICDVMGHGVRAALVAAIVRALVSEGNGPAERPGEFLERLNRKLYGILSQTEIPMFASASYVVADIKKGEITFANAGHPEPLCIRRGSGSATALALEKSARGPVLGMFESPKYGSGSCPLTVRDVVLQFTDGLYEVEGAGGELYDEQCLMRAVNRRTNLGAGELCRQVLAEIQQFSANKQFSDDVCLVAVEVDHLGAA